MAIFLSCEANRSRSARAQPSRINRSKRTSASMVSSSTIPLTNSTVSGSVESDNAVSCSRMSSSSGSDMAMNGWAVLRTEVEAGRAAVGRSPPGADRRARPATTPAAFLLHPCP